MKNALLTTLLAAAVMTPVLAYAQEQASPLTRAEVRADLIQLEHAGYQPGVQNVTYPADIQAAENRVHGGAVDGKAGHAYGGSSYGTGESSLTKVPAQGSKLFSHH